jgi:hypothetical protein
MGRRANVGWIPVGAARAAPAGLPEPIRFCEDLRFAMDKVKRKIASLRN